MYNFKLAEIALFGAGPRGEPNLGSVIKRFLRLLRFGTDAEDVILIVPDEMDDPPGLGGQGPDQAALKF